MTEKKESHVKFLALNLASNATNEQIAEAILRWARKNTEEAEAQKMAEKAHQDTDSDDN